MTITEAIAAVRLALAGYRKTRQGIEAGKEIRKHGKRAIGKAREHRRWANWIRGAMR